MHQQIFSYRAAHAFLLRAKYQSLFSTLWKGCPNVPLPSVSAQHSRVLCTISFPAVAPYLDQSEVKLVHPRGQPCCQSPSLSRFRLLRGVARLLASWLVCGSTQWRAKRVFEANVL